MCIYIYIYVYIHAFRSIMSILCKELTIITTLGSTMWRKAVLYKVALFLCLPFRLPVETIQN